MISRKLGLIESIFGQFYEGNFNVINEIYLKGGLTVDIVKQAMHLVVLKNPLLNTTIHKINGSFVLVLKKEISLPIHVLKNCKESSLGAEITIESDVLWNMTIFTEDEHVAKIVFRNHHVILDEISVSAVIAELLNHCDEIMCHVEHVGENQELQSLPETIENIFLEKKPPTFFNSLKGRLLYLTLSFRAIFKTRNEKKKDEFLDNDGLIFRMSELGEKNVETIIKESKKRDTTVHAVLSAASTMSYAELMPRSHRIRGTSVFDIRRYCDTELKKADAPGCAIGIADHVRTKIPTGTDFWNLAKTCKETLNRSTAYMFTLYRYLIYAGHGPDFFFKTFFLIPQDINISNRGAFNIDLKTKVFSIDKIFYYQQPQITERISHWVITFNKKMFIVTGYQSKIMTREFMETYIEKFLSQLKFIQE